MSALLMKQMLEGAEHQGAALAFDTSHVEDQGVYVQRNAAKTKVSPHLFPL